jgi:hypothetical protein
MENIILEKDFNILKNELIETKNPKCILCKNNKWTDYGDEKNGFVFCKDCFDIYSCFCCKKMNISTYGRKVVIRPFNGLRFKIFCTYCWKNKNVYENDNTDELELELETINYELHDEDLVDDSSSSDEEINNHDLYHSTKGKYDLY